MLPRVEPQRGTPWNGDWSPWAGQLSFLNSVQERKKGVAAVSPFYSTIQGGFMYLAFRLAV